MSASRRPCCPFYGFEWPDRSTKIRDCGDDRCGLLWDENRRCAMEEAGKTVSIHNCEIANRRRLILDAASGVVLFYPREHPEGVSFSRWMLEIAR